MKSLRTLVHRLPVRLVVSHELSLSMRMRLRYEAGDPYAVRAAFSRVDSDEAVEWVFGRDLLIDGLKGPVGEGDIHLSPVGEYDRHTVYIALKSPAGVALLEAPARGINTFLQETEALVPRGAECGHIDLEAELAHVFWR